MHPFTLYMTYLCTMQVNIPSDMACGVLNRLSKGRVTRGLFHKASLSLFPVLITMWKRFCAHRFDQAKGKTTVRERQAPVVASILTQFDQQRLFLGKLLHINSSIIHFTCTHKYKYN